MFSKDGGVEMFNGRQHGSWNAVSESRLSNRNYGVLHGLKAGIRR